MLNAVAHGAKGVTVGIGDTVAPFYVADKSPGIQSGERDTAFDTGYSASDTGIGFEAIIGKRIVETHGWDITLTESDGGGAPFAITDVELVGK